MAKQVTTITCEDCPKYADPVKKMIYPNTDNEALGWVICGVGNTVKRDTMACQRHPLKERGQQERTDVLIAGDGGLNAHKLARGVAKLPQEAKKPLVSKSSELLGGVDFGASLLKDIEAMVGGL